MLEISDILYEIVATVVILLITFILYRISKSYITSIVEANQLKTSRGILMNKLLGATAVLIATALLIFVWGVDVGNLWVFASGVLALIAVAFFAMWSMLSNVVAAIFIFVSDPFRIEDEIIVLPDDIQGVVVDIKTLFVVLEDKDGNTLHIPNNLFFQKITKTVNVPVQPSD